MNGNGLRHAWERFHKAEAARKHMLASDDFQKLESAWREFLQAANAVFVKLELAAKSDTRAAPWFGQKTHARKQDDLMCYLHHARNSDEHSLQDVTTGRPGQVSIVSEGSIQIAWTDGDSVAQVSSLEDKPIKMERGPPRVELLPVVDRSKTYEVPAKYRGAVLDAPQLAAVAAVALDEIRAVLDEAGQFSKTA